jgi:hypothetical protein
VARSFQRQSVRVGYESSHDEKSEDTFITIQLQYRNDNTRRELPEVLPQVDWNNQVLSSSLDLHWNKRWVTNLGWQSIQFKGSEVQSVKDFNGEIINFKPYVQDGSEQMKFLKMVRSRF